MLTYLRQRAPLALFVLILSACGTFEMGLEPATTPPVITPSVAAEATPLPTLVGELQPTPTAEIAEPTRPPTTESVPTMTPMVGLSDPVEAMTSPLWVTYRDSEYGYGLALPCYWIILPGHGSPSTRSYDEAFAMTHSIRGSWRDGEPPAGAINPDIFVFEFGQRGIAASTPLREAIPQLIDDAIQEMEEVTLGSQTALVVHLAGEGTPDYFANQLYFFQLSPDSTLMINPKWKRALESTDMQAILASVALSVEEEVVPPDIPPSGPVEDREIYLNEAAGYCFQYPTEFTLEQYNPSQPGILGKLATLKIERPLYTAGLTVEVQTVGSRELEESVSGFLNQFADMPSASIERNPVELVGGIEYQLGGEPAEVLEGVPGPEGSRDVFAIHDGRLYHLSFSPFYLNNPQAGNDVGLLYNIVTASFTFLPVKGQ
jgi:hypothetical protein